VPRNSYEDWKSITEFEAFSHSCQYVVQTESQLYFTPLLGSGKSQDVQKLMDTFSLEGEMEVRAFGLLFSGQLEYKPGGKVVCVTQIEMD